MQPVSLAQIHAKGRWEDVRDTSLRFDLGQRTTLRFVYSMHVRPSSAILATEVDAIEARLVVDGRPYRESGSAFRSRTRTFKDGVLMGNLVLELDAGARHVKLQWKKWGGGVGMWTSSPAFLDGFVSGRSIAVAGLWSPLIFREDLGGDTTRRVGLEQTGVTVNEPDAPGLQLAVGSQVMRVDEEDASVAVPVGAGVYRADGAEIGVVKGHLGSFGDGQALRFDATLAAAADGAALWKGATLATQENRDEWRASKNTSVSFTLPADGGNVLLAQLLPLLWPLGSLASRTAAGLRTTTSDMWTFKRWSSLATRLVVDGKPYRITGARADPAVQATDSLAGNVAIRMRRGAHTAEMQWRVIDSTVTLSEWRTLKTRMDGFGGGKVLVAMVNAWNQAPSVSCAVGVLVAREDQQTTLPRSFWTTPAGLDAGAVMTLSLSAGHALWLDADRTNLSFQEGDGVADAQVEVTGPLADLNRAVRAMRYHPSTTGGQDVIQVSLDDRGNGGAGGA